MSADNLLEKECYELLRNPYVEIDDTEYDIREREDFFAAIRSKYDGFSIKGNYDGKGDDIALFSGDHFDANSAKLLIDGTWTDWLELDEARALYLKACGLSADGPSL